MIITTAHAWAVVVGLLLIAACLVGVGLAIGARVLSRDAVIRRARRRDARRLARARARAQAADEYKLRLASRGVKVGVVDVPHAPPVPVRDFVATTSPPDPEDPHDGTWG